MLTALVGALIDFIRLLAEWLVSIALWLETSPLGVAWPIFLALVLQLLMFLLSIFVWWSRGTLWPIACAYPRTTTGKGPCRNRVLGEWRRCRLHRQSWQRRSDRHLVDPNLRRWQTIRRGKVVEVEHLQGSGFLRTRSDVIGILYYRGFARPPRDVARLAPLLAAEYRRRLAQLRATLGRRRRTSPREAGGAGGSLVLEDTIEATRFVVGLLTIGLAFIGLAILLRQRVPTAPPARATLEYSAVFFLYFAVVMFKNGIVGRRATNGVVSPASDWLQRSWSEAANTFAVTILLAIATVFAVTLILPLLTLGGVVLFLMFLAALDSPPPRRRRRRRRSW